MVLSKMAKNLFRGALRLCHYVLSLPV